MRAWLALLLLVGCAPHSEVLGDRRVIRSAHGFQTVSMLDGGETELYFDWGARIGLLKPDARRVVLLGMGGGEMLRAARRTLPAAELVGVEIDPAIAALAISDFGVLELGVHVVVGEGAHYLAQQPRGSVDGLIVDVFNDNQLPGPFLDLETFSSAHRALGPGGVFMMNVYPPSLAPFVMLQLERADFHSVHPWALADGDVMVTARP